jgi:protein-disulfide isomerase-like protein with CxxC motif
MVLLVVVAIGSCFMDGAGIASGGRPSLKPHELDELRRDWLRVKINTGTRYGAIT